MTIGTSLVYRKDTLLKAKTVTDDHPLPVSLALDTGLALAINEVFNLYGDVISVSQRAQNLLKFGRTPNADNGVRTTVAEFGSVGSENVNETFVSTNIIDEISSSSGSDTGVVVVEGHTIDGSGNLTFIEQDVTLDGQTPVALGTPLARASRLYVKDGTFASPASDLVGNIYVYDSSATTVVSGVPQTNAAVKLRIVAGRNQSDKAATSIASSDYLIVTNMAFSMTRTVGSAVSVDFEVEHRHLGGVWRPFGAVVDVDREAPYVNVPLFPYRVIQPNSDLRVVATSNTNSTEVTAFIEGVLAVIV